MGEGSSHPHRAGSEAVDRHPRAGALHHPGDGLLLGLLLVGLCVLEVTSALGFLHRPADVLETDHYAYIQLARALAGEGDHPGAPFGHRVLVPFLAHQLTRAGLELDAAFFLLSQLGLVGFLAGLHHLLELRGFDRSRCALGVLLAGLLPGAVRWYGYQYWMTDPLALFLIVAALILIERQQDGWLALVAVAGFMTRESFLVVLAYHLVRRCRERGLRGGLGRTLAVFAGPLLLLAFLRARLPVPAGPAFYRGMASLLAWRLENPHQLYACTLGSFGVLFVLLALDPRRLVHIGRRRPEDGLFAALIAGSLLLGNNTDRLLAYALPVLLPAALTCLNAFHPAGRVPARAMGALVLGQFFLHLRTPLAGVERLSLDPRTDPAVVIAMLAVARVLWSGSRSRFRAGQGGWPG